MAQNHFSAFIDRQRGAALLIFMLIGAIAALSLFLNRLVTRSTITNNQATMQTLAMAKEAIIGWSASRNTTPGMLPCPEDTTLIGNPLTEGTALLSCGNSLQVGRLPWRTLKLPQLRDETGEPLWYALSPGFRTSPINGNTIAQLTVDGTPNSAAAIIFSPGAPLAGQNRPLPTSALPPNVAQYLDGINNTGTTSFVTTGAPGVFNDRLVTITRSDLFRAVNRRILSEIRGDGATGLLNYYSANGNNFPWASADLGGVPFVSQLNGFIPHTELTPLFASATNTSMASNIWYPLITYNVNLSRQQVTMTINTPTPVSCTITPSQPTCQ